MINQHSYGENLEVNWLLGETTVYGTVVRPTGPGPFPAVVTVSYTHLTLPTIYSV